MILDAWLCAKNWRIKDELKVLQESAATTDQVKELRSEGQKLYVTMMIIGYITVAPL